ncbi:hypothetical protein N665_2731s0002 [Sinapis alba]|nr:hypothetical protein N665_2731s0002 [Sinapis alba]
MGHFSCTAGTSLDQPSVLPGWTKLQTPMEEDDPPACSPVVSQYAAQHYVQKTPIHTPPVHISPPHNSPVTNSPVHNSLVHKSPVYTSPIHTTPVHNGPEHTPPGHSGPEHTPPIHSGAEHTTPETTVAVHTLSTLTTGAIDPPSAHQSSPLYDTSAAPLNLQASPTPTPNSPSISEILFQGVQINDPISPDPVTPTQPKYDSSTNPASRVLRSPLPFTPENSPNKSSDSLSGFAVHASSVNAFSATATSNPYHVSNSTIPTHQAHQTANSDIVELSDGSPARQHPRHFPCMEENYVAKQLFQCPSIPALSLLSPLPQIQWDMFEKTVSKLKEDTLTEIVLKPGRKWMEDVTTVYTPMIWADTHWVGLAINLDLGLVEILDPLPTLYADRKVARFMDPVLKSLPYLVKKVAMYEPTQFRNLEPFTWTRVPDIYINERSGDCGPVSVKFMELHAHGDPAPHMSGITDRTVDAFRKQYTLDIYKTYVLPAYYAPPKQ